jgi:WD40 repeat protein/serine/threonine protein kinase/tetratricopeptide (TPR) repeat protein
MAESEARSARVLELAEEFLERYRKGERPSLREYIDRHPDLAAEIRDVFPAMAMMENVAVADSSLEGDEAKNRARAAELALKQLGDYRIIREIGHGGMGVVYEAEQVSLGRHVALKVLPSQALANAKQKRRFEREAKAAAKLHHTNIVPVFGVGEHEGLPYYVMQFIQGLGLDVVLEELNHLKPNDGHTPTGLPSAGEIRISRRSMTAAEVARSLLTGRFELARDSDRDPDADARPTVGATVELPLAAAAASSALSPSTSASGRSESFTLSSSSVVLPGSSTSAASRSRSKKQSYWHSVANIGRQVADALDYAHKQGVLHRDVKPSNLLLDLRGTVWVTDFGLAKVAGPGGDNLTHTGDILGTLRYMPPEAFEGKSDARGDVYSLGLTMYELLAMRPAFDEKDRHKLIKHVTTGEPTPLHRVNREAPRDLVTIIHKAIDRDPSRRYATADDMASDLQRFLDDEPILARRQTQLERYLRWARRNPGMAVLGGVLTAVLLIATLASLMVAGRMATLADDARQKEDNARQSQQVTAKALATVEESLSKTAAAERLARAAEGEGRKLLYTTDMQLVPFLWKDPLATVAQLRGRLNTHDPAQNQSLAGKEDLRGFEWYYYNQVLENSAAVFSAHGASFIDAVFTANGQLTTLDEYAQVRRWDIASQGEDAARRRELPHGRSAQVRVLSPDGRLAALAEGDKVRLFDISTEKEILQIDSAPVALRRVSFSGDSRTLVIVDKKIRWCSAVDGAVIASFDRQFNHVVSIALSADGLTLAVIGHANNPQEFSIYRLDAMTKTVTPLQTNTHVQWPLSVGAMSPDGQQFVLAEVLRGGFHGFITAPYSYNTWHATAHASPVSAIVFSGDGTQVATADAEGTIKVWDAHKLTARSPGQKRVRDVRSGEQEPARLTLKGHQGAVSSIHFSSDGKRLVTTGVDHTVRVWDLQNPGVAIRQLEESPWSEIARYSPDGLLVVDVWDYGHKIVLWDAASGRRVREIQTTGKAVARAEFSPTDNRLLAVGYARQDGVPSVGLWDIDAGTELALLPGGSDRVTALAFSPDGKYLVAAFGSPYALAVWDVASRRLIHRLNGHAGPCDSLNFARDGSLLASGSYDGTAIVWSTASWSALHRLVNPDRTFVLDVAFAPDGKTLAMASDRGNVQLWDVAGGKLRDTLKGHSSKVKAVAFAPDGRTLASGSYDQTVRLWSIETRRQLMRLDLGRVELGTVFRLAFSPDGKQLLAGGLRMAVWSAAPILWNDPDQAAEKLRLLLNSNADFRGRIRMLSEHLRLHEALAKLESQEVRVQAALAATRANWHASQDRWAEAAREFNRLLAIEPTEPEAWLRTPGLLRLATALLHQDRPLDAARLLQGGAQRRSQDGLPSLARVSGFGLRHIVDGGVVRISGLEPDSLASRGKLRPGDVILKLNGGDMTQKQIAVFEKTLKGDTETKMRLTVRHPFSNQTEDVDLVRQEYRVDDATGDLFFPLLAAIAKRLADDPIDAGLLELRTELNRQATDFPKQVADYTAVIDVLAEQPAKAEPARLRRLYRCRGDAYGSLQQWQKAVDDYAHVITAETTDALVLANRARALEALGHWDAAAADWWRVATGSPEGAKPLAEFTQRLAAVGQVALADATLAKTRAWYEARLSKEPENATWAAALGELLLSRDAKSDAGKRHRLVAIKLTDPWARLAAAYQILGEQPVLDRLLKQHPAAAAGIGDLYADDEDWERAIAEYSKVITDQPSNGDVLVKRARAYEATKRGDLAAADWQRAAPQQSYIVFESAYRLVQSGVRAFETGRLPEAIADLQAARDLLRILAKHNPTDGQVASNLSISVGFLGSAFRDSKRPADALAALEEQRSVLESIPNPPSIDLYNLACCYAQLSVMLEHAATSPSATERAALADQAMESLRRSIAAGMTNFALIERDHDLDPLRERADFRALILESTSRTSEKESSEKK